MDGFTAPQEVRQRAAEPLLLYRPQPNRRRAILHALNRLATLAEALTAKYIEATDAEDTDPDLEPDVDGEPWLGSIEAAQHLVVTARSETGHVLATELSDPLDQRRWADFALADLEEVSEDEGAQCDDEGMCGAWDPDLEESDHGGTDCEDDGPMGGADCNPVPPLMSGADAGRVYPRRPPPVRPLVRLPAPNSEFRAEVMVPRGHKVMERFKPKARAEFRPAPR
jgi:hypothetical protein